jgi:hypothetical protein
VAGLPSFARERWAVDGIRPAARHAAFGALGRPQWLRRRLIAGTRHGSLAVRTLVPADGRALDLTGNNHDNLLVTGWSFAEPGGRWTDGREAVLALRHGASRGDGLPVRVVATSCVNALHPDLAVDVWANDVRIARWHFHHDRPGPREHSFVIPDAALRRTGTLELAFAMDATFEPVAHDVYGSDQRRLGLFVTEVTAGAPQVPGVFERPLLLGSGAADRIVLWEGFSQPDADGVWTDGPAGRVRLRVPHGRTGALAAVFDGVACGPGVDPAAVTVAVGGRPLQTTWTANGSSGPSLSVAIPGAGVAADGSLTIDLRAPGAAAVAGDDGRRLGIRLAALRLRPSPGDEPAT